VLLVGAAAVVACSLRRGLRLPVVLVFGTTVLLLTTPSWFFHYTALIAAPGALLLGGAAVVAFDWVRGRGGQRTVILVGATACVALVLASHALIGKKLDERFPARSLRAAVAGRSGCTTTDWPTALIQMNLLSRSIEQGCRFEADLGGWSYDLGSDALRRSPRARNAEWQQFALDYLRSGDATLIIRFERIPGFDAANTKTYENWPAIASVGKYVVRDPHR
jgi:hypothetical protein